MYSMNLHKLRTTFSSRSSSFIFFCFSLKFTHTMYGRNVSDVYNAERKEQRQQPKTSTKRYLQQIVKAQIQQVKL